MEPKAKATRAKPVLELSPLQPVERDFAFLVDRGVKAADIVRAAHGHRPVRWPRWPSRRSGARWRATVDETGHYVCAMAL
jgi:hypothetical protein